MGSDAIRLLNKSKLPRNYAWYSLKQAVEVDVRNTLPLKSNPDQCALSIFTGMEWRDFVTEPFFGMGWRVL